MLAHCYKASQETDSCAKSKTNRKKRPINLRNRQKLHQPGKRRELYHDIINDLFIKDIDQTEREQRTDQSDQNTFYYKRGTYEKVRRTDVFHNFNL